MVSPSSSSIVNNSTPGSVRDGAGVRVNNDIGIVVMTVMVMLMMMMMVSPFSIPILNNVTPAHICKHMRAHANTHRHTNQRDCRDLDIRGIHTCIHRNFQTNTCTHTCTHIHK
jgi:hypothetical protein